MRMLWASVAALLLAACAAPGPPPALRLGAEDIPADKRIVWPAPPEPARYAYAGQLTGEQNFQGDKDDPKRGVGGFLRWLAGVISGESAPVVLQRPQSGAVDAQGRIYIADSSRQAVFVFDRASGKLQVWDRAEGLRGFSAPAGIALGPAGEVWVSDAELGIVARLERDGNPGRSLGRGLLKRPTGLAYDGAAGELYVADTYAHDIKVIDREGRLARTIGRRGEAPGEFNYPTHLALAGGELYVTDTMNGRVQAIPLAGGAPRVIGRRGLWVGDLVRPKGVAVDAEGHVYVVESYYDHLLVFDRRGELLLAIGGTGQGMGRFYLPSGVWTDAAGRVYVADMFNGRVMVLQYLGGGERHANR